MLDALVGPGAVAGDARERSASGCAPASSNDKEIEIQVADTPVGLADVRHSRRAGRPIGVINIGDMLGKAFGQRTKPRRVTVADSHDILIAEESDKLLDRSR